jgi:hypothetical protein
MDNQPDQASPLPPISLDAYSTDNVATKFREAVGLASEDEMASILQISHETLATWRTRRKGPPFIKLGKKAFYCISSFSQWINHEVERQQALKLPRLRKRIQPAPAPTPLREDEKQAAQHVNY